jgi:hypothetical protein
MSAVEYVIVHLFYSEHQKVIQSLLIKYLCYIMWIVLEYVLIDFAIAEENYVSYLLCWPVLAIYRNLGISICIKTFMSSPSMKFLEAEYRCWSSVHYMLCILDKTF